jgi:hypothetical protein
MTTKEKREIAIFGAILAFGIPLLMAATHAIS